MNDWHSSASYVARNVAQYYNSGHTLKKAVAHALGDISDEGISYAVAAIDAEGNSVIESSARLFSVAWGSSYASTKSCLQPNTLPVLQSHTIYSDELVLIGHSRYPTTPGHTAAVIRRESDLFSLPQDDFVDVLKLLSRTSSCLQMYYGVERCALITEGGKFLSLLPLHGLSKDWKPVTSDLKEFHETFPGYISSKDGPPMANDKLDAVCAAIQAVSFAVKPLNNHFSGPNEDTNLFTRIIRGELPHWRVWEDKNHVAFLTPFPNTPGSTILVPRRHLSSNIFSIGEESFSALMVAVHKLAGILKKTFKASQCGMVFEGCGIDYAHVKLVPIHRAESKEHTLTNEKPWKVASFNEKYEGYVSSLAGPLTENFKSLSRSSLKIREMFSVHAPSPPKTRENPLSDWPFCLLPRSSTEPLTVSDILSNTLWRFFDDKLGYQYFHLPTIEEPSSSPMGSASGAEPLSAVFINQQYFADSAQFAVEDNLRSYSWLPGIFFVQGADAVPLNPVSQVRCELVGSFSLGISVAESYVINLVTVLYKYHRSLVERIAGTVEHLASFLDHFRFSGEKLLQITLDDALNLSIMDNSCWKYLVSSGLNKGRALTRTGAMRLINHFGGAIWVTELDHLSVPFYQAFTDETHTKARCANLLLGDGEVLLTLGERHKNAKDVLAALEQRKIPPQSYQSSYVSIRNRHPEISTTGWEMETERLLTWLFVRGTFISESLSVAELQNLLMPDLQKLSMPDLGNVL